MKWYVLFLFYVTFSDGANILGVYNHPGTSHTFLGKILLKKLAERGHQVVMISSFPIKEKIYNYRDIVLEKHLEDLHRIRNDTNNRLDYDFQQLINMTRRHTEDTFTDPQVQELLKSNQTFDLVIIDWFYNEATLIFGHIYKAPVIYMSSFGNMFLLTDFTGNVLPYSYVPGAGLFATDELSFKDRIIMTLVNVIFSLYVLRKNSNAHHEILKRHFENIPTIEELQQNVALVLSNSHFSLETPRPYTPNIIPIGGFHVEEPKELPQELQKFLDDAKQGVILFALGSQVKSSNFNKDRFSSIIRALGRVRQKVLWKYEKDDISEIPENIKIMKWLPQEEVLAHPNVKLFITHGGMLSFIEAIYFNVPLICLPFYGDQITNAAFIESREIGLHLSPDNITEGAVFNAILEVTTNPKYQQQMSYRSFLLREQPVKPLDLAIYWTEHVIEHGHGNHLKTFATKLPWYKYYLVDIISFLLCVAYVFVKLFLLFSKLIMKNIYSLFYKAKKFKSD